jgi:signal transduction histidine kinase
MGGAMQAVQAILSWFAGDGRYMNLVHCMDGDAPWIALTVVLDMAVAAGYFVIVRHWAQNERMLAESPAKSALRSIKAVCIFCGICGYVFIPIEMVWPAWRLYDIALGALVYFTWRYALGAEQLRVVYTQLDQTEQLRGELERSRVEARRKNLFLNSVSHDIRTPLNGMSLQAELAEMCLATGDAEGVRESLAEIRRSARAAGDLLAELLEVGRLEWSGGSMVLEPVALKPAIEAVLESCRAMAERKGLALAAEVDGGLSVQTDGRLLDRILRNLVENGIKYTHTGGVRIIVEAAGDAVEVHAIDTGIGIAEGQQALVFQEFFQVENRERDRSRGFGLGLAIASRLAGQLGGGLRLESRLGHGSRFTLRLPRTLPAGVVGDRKGDDGRPSQRGEPAPTLIG